MWAVAMHTHGTFIAWATDPSAHLDDAVSFVTNPPAEWAPRPQDSLQIYELDLVDQVEYRLGACSDGEADGHPTTLGGV